MERFMMNDGGVQALVSQIGCVFDGSFFVSDEGEATDALEELITLLNEDDKKTCRIRCQMHLAHILPQKLVPLLVYLDEEEEEEIEDKAKLYSLTIRLMTNLTQPTECLLPSYLYEQSKNLVCEMNRYLAVGRDAFLDGKPIMVLLKHMERLLVQAQNKEMAIGDCEILNNCLFLFRNLLFIHDIDYRSDDGPRPYLILLGMLFQHGLTEVLSMVLKSAQREYWCISAAQLVSLLYKDKVSALTSTSRTCTTSQGLPVDHLTCLDTDHEFPVRCANHTCENSLNDSCVASPNFEKTNQSDNSALGDWLRAGPNSPNSPNSSLQSQSLPSHSPPSPRSPHFTAAEGSLASQDGQQHDSKSDSSPEGHSQSPATSEHNSPHPSQSYLNPTPSPESVPSPGSPHAHSTHSESPQSNSPQSNSPSTRSTFCSASTSGDVRQKGINKLENEISLRLYQLKIREQLSIFTRKFLEDGFVNLVTAMRSILLDSQQSRLPDLYFMWIVGYFLNWALTLRIPFKCFKPCLSVDIVGFLVYLGVNSCEQLLVALQGEKDPAAAVQRNQLVVVALNRLFMAMDHLEELEMDEEDVEHLQHLHCNTNRTTAGQICTPAALVRMREVKNFFVLMLRHYTPSALCLDHLRDIIMTNHKFLLIAEKARTQNMDSSEFDMLQHIQSFSTTTIMGQYCRLLENFNKNSTEVNDCIFTMMYHVAGDVNRPEVLLQLPILKVFTEISETCINLPRECNDVMNYVLQYFLNLASNDPYRCAEMLFGNMNNETDMEVADNDGDDGEVRMDDDAKEGWNNWSDAEKDILFSLYSEESESPNLVSKIKEALAEDGFERTPNEITVQLCLQNLWSEDQIEKLIHTNKDTGEDESSDQNIDSVSQINSDFSEVDIQSCRRSSMMQVDSDQSSSSASSSSGCSSGRSRSPNKDLEPPGVEHLVGHMVLQGHQDIINWLQNVLLETCYVKLGGRFLREGWVPEEPVILHYTIQNKSVPLVPYTESEEWALGCPDFQQILKLLGFHLPQMGVAVWPRIPHTWTPMEIIAKARLLGPVDLEAQKFEEEDLHKQAELTENTEIMSESGSPAPPSPAKAHMPGMHMSDLWHVFVRQCTLYNKKQFDVQRMPMFSNQPKT